MSSLVYTNAAPADGYTLFNDLKTLLTSPFSSSMPQGCGWKLFFNGTNDFIALSLGSSQSERIYVRLTLSNDATYISRTIFQASSLDGATTVNSFGGGTTSRINVGASPFQYWFVGNQDFFMLTTLVGTEYDNYYSGIINRFGPNQNSSIYGITPPTPANTTTPAAIFTIGTDTPLYLRVGFDGYGGFGANNISFIPGQKLTIVDQSVGTATSGHIGTVILNSAATITNSIIVSYLSGANTFSSFSMIGTDPQPNALSTSGTIFTNPILMINDGYGDASPQFFAEDEENCCVPNDLQNPTIRKVYIGYAIRISNSTEVRGTLYGVVQTPVATASSQDIYATYDGLYKFINFADDDKFISIGSVI